MSARRRAGERQANAILLPVPGAATPLDDPASPPLPLGSPRRRAGSRRSGSPRRTVHRPVRRPPQPAPTPAPAAPQVVTGPAASGWTVPLLVVMIGSFMALLDTS